MKFNSIFNSFSAGELSRNLFGRTDLEEYFKGVSEMTNFIPIRQGGASFRTGTVAVTGAYGDVPGCMIEFSPRDSEKYLVNLRPGRPILIFNSDGLSSTVTQPTYPWNERIDFSSATNAYNGPSDDATNRTLVESIQTASSGDVLIIVDGTGRLAPIVILRTAANTFIVDSLIFPNSLNPLSAPFLYPPVPTLRVPYKDVNINTNIRLINSATTGSITITSQNASAVAIPFFSGNVVGMMVKITHGSTTGVATIVSKVSDSVVNAIVDVTFGAATAQTAFETSSWNPVDGYPRTVCFHEGRLIFGGNTKYPDMLWCSHTGNIYHFMQRRLTQDVTTDASGLNYFGAVKVTDPFNFIPAAVGANNIQWLYPADSLLVGTTGNEFSITGGQEITMSVSSLFVKSISSHGSSKVQPVKVGSSVLFISIDGKRVLEIPKRLVEYTSATDWTGLAAGIVEKSIESITSSLNTVVPLKSKITKLSWDESTGVLWCLVKNTGNDSTTLLTLTIDKTSKVVAWAKHKIGGTPFISSITAIQDTTNTGCVRVFIYLKRSNALNYAIESFSYRTMHDSHLPSQITSDVPATIYLDGAAFADVLAPNVLTIQAINRDTFAPGATYGVIKVDGGIGTYLGAYTDTNVSALSSPGTLSISGIDASKEYIIGALYEGEIKTMPIEAGAQFGVAQGSPRRVHEIVVYLDRSLGGIYGASKSSNRFPIVGTKGTPTALYTGEVKLSLNASPDDHQIVIKQTTPYPLTILWLLTKGYTYDV